MNTNVIWQEDELVNGMDKLWNKLHGKDEHGDLNYWVGCSRECVAQRAHGNR